MGVDGSEGGLLALEVAVEEAALHQASLRVVTAWEMPPAVVAGFAYDSGYYQRTMREAKQHAVDIATKALARVAELQPSLPCEKRVVEGHQVKVILEEAKDAIRIVVGARGHGGFAGLLLGWWCRQEQQSLREPAGRPLTCRP